jgi:hypothetical protein
MPSRGWEHPLPSPLVLVVVVPSLRVRVRALEKYLEVLRTV